MIYISNALYLAEVSASNFVNKPLIGWKSNLRLEDFSSSDGPDAGIMWSPDTYSYWASDPVTSGSPIEFVINLYNNNAETVNYIGIAGHNFYKNASPSNFTFLLEYSFDNVTFTDAFPESATISNAALMIYFDDVAATYFRLTIKSLAGTDVSAQIAHLRLGKILRLQRKIYVGVSPFGLNKKVEKTISVSDNGKYLGGVTKSTVNLYTLPQMDNTPDFVRQEINDFLDHTDLLSPSWNNGPTGTFFAAWRPDEYPAEILYCHPAITINRPTNQRSNGMMQWTISGEAEA